MSIWASTGLDSVSVGENFTTILPKYPKASGTMPGVIYCHGNTGHSWEPLAPEINPVVAALAGAGYPVLAGDWGGASAWANDTALAAITSGRTYLQSTLGAKAGKVVLIGASMGGGTAMVWAATNPTLASCVVGMLPASDFTDIVTNNRGGLASVVNAAYSGGWSEATYGAAHNPKTMAAAGKLSLPMRLFYGASDATVLPATVTGLAASAGVNTLATSVPGDHVMSTYAQIDPATVLAFVRANA